MNCFGIILHVPPGTPNVYNCRNHPNDDSEQTHNIGTTLTQRQGNASTLIRSCGFSVFFRLDAQMILPQHSMSKERPCHVRIGSSTSMERCV